MKSEGLMRDTLPPGDDVLYVAFTGWVFALDKRDGSRRWKNELKGLRYGIVSMWPNLATNSLFVSTGGQLVALSLTTGEERWRNGLKGMGYQTPGLAMSPPPAGQPLPCAPSENVLSPQAQDPTLQRLLYVGVRGKVKCVDALTGADVWTHDLPGYYTPALLMDGWVLFVALGNAVYCIEARTGRVAWCNAKVESGFMSAGYGRYTTLCTLASSANNANVLTSSQPLLHLYEEDTQEQTNSAGGA